MKILLADDHAILRHGLKELLCREFPKAEFGEAETAQAALELVWGGAWEIVVLDVSMPGRSGLDVLAEIKRCRPGLPVLVLSMHSEEQYAIRVLEAGADGYITKARAPMEMLVAVRKLLAGGKYVSAAVAEHLASNLRPGKSGPPHLRLSNREYQVLRMIASGQSTKSIAAELSLSPQTVSTHRARLLKKMRLNTTTDLIRYALENKLIA